jgi:thiol-disulfide isomerase/thioredoxin
MTDPIETPGPSQPEMPAADLAAPPPSVPPAPQRRGLYVAFIVAALVVCGAIGIGLAHRLTKMADATHAAYVAEAGTPAPEAISSGDGVTVRFSDKPIPVPAFSLTDLEGRPVRPSDWRGKTVLVNFWATWCGPCRSEIPALMALQHRYAQQLLIVGLSIDEGDPADVKSFVQQLKMNYPVAIANADLEQQFGGVTAVPTTLVVKPDGTIVTRHVGALDPVVTEQEVRILSGLPTSAKVEYVKDQGQVLLANAAYATEIPGVDLAKLTPAQKTDVLKQLNTDTCTCGCGNTLAACRINDPSCAVSLPLAKDVVRKIKSR